MYGINVIYTMKSGKREEFLAGVAASGAQAAVLRGRRAVCNTTISPRWMTRTNCSCWRSGPLGRPRRSTWASLIWR